MKQRKWESKTKARAVLEGIKGRKVAEICNDYQWREQFLSNLDKPFEVKKASSRKERLKSEVEKLRSLVGELTLELKKPKKGCYEKKNFTCCDREKQTSLEANRGAEKRASFWGYRRIWAHLVYVD